MDALRGPGPAKEPVFRAALETLHDLPIVGDVRGAGYFFGIELVRDQETKEPFGAEDALALTAGFLTPEIERRGLICRASDRGYPVLQLAPPLIAGGEQFEEIVSVLRPVLQAAGDRVFARG